MRRRVDWVGVAAVLLMLVVLAGWALWLFASDADAHTRHRCRGERACYVHVYRHFDSGVQAKLRRVGECESGNNPRATSPGGRYLGAFQYDWQTARYAGFRTDPRATSWFEQAVRTWRLVQREGSWGRWPVCGYR